MQINLIVPSNNNNIDVILGIEMTNYFTDISKDEWIKVIEACVPPKFLEMNKKAFELGVNA